MAKRWLLNVLTKVLGEFVELNETNLNLAVWSGQIVLNNVCLKTDKLLREFNFVVYHGMIQQLEVTIPWTTLLINPVKIVVKGILLDVGPLDISQFNMIERIQRFLDEKVRKLNILEKYLDLYLSLNGENGEASNDKQESSSSSYYQQWTTKIIDNIEVKVSQVHLRYEDTLSVSDRCFACGITLQSFGISTLDEDWNPSSSTNTAGAASVYKLADMKSVGVYWQPDAARISSLPLREWQEVMMHMIYNSTHLPPTKSINPGIREAVGDHKGLLTGDAELFSDLTTAAGTGNANEVAKNILPVIPREAYLLLPYNNSFSLKMIHNKKPVGDIPRFHVTASSSKLKLAFDSTQYIQLFAIIDRINALGKVHLPFGLRPRDRPIGYNLVKAWWQYAVKLVIREKVYVKLVKKKMKWLACLRQRKHDEENAQKSDGGNDEIIEKEIRRYTLTKRESQAIEEMERRIPFSAIRMFRQNAVLQLVNESKAKFNASKRNLKSSDATSWWGAWFNGPQERAQTSLSSPEQVPSSSVEDKDIPIHSIVQALNEGDTITNSNQPSSTIMQPTLNHKQGTGGVTKIGNGILFTLKLTTSSKLTIFSNSTPIIESTTAVSLSVKKSSSDGMAISVNLNDLTVIDKYTESPTVPQLISVQKAPRNKFSQSPSLPDHQFSNAFATSPVDGYDDESEPKATCSVNFEKTDEKSRLFITALPITLCLNHDCIYKLFNEFTRPPNRYENKQKRRSPVVRPDTAHGKSNDQSHPTPMEEKKRARTRRHSTPGTLQRTATAKVFKQMISAEAASFEIIFEANAPKIIVPEDCCKERGFLLLDTGYLVLKGAAGGEGMTLNLSLHDIHAGLPRTVHDVNRIGEKSLYLIKPFDIALRIQNVDQHLANLTVDCEVHPELRGEIDSLKLARLLTGLGQISSMFSRPSTLPSRSNNNSSGQLTPSIVSTPASTTQSRKSAVPSMADNSEQMQMEFTAEQLETHNADGEAASNVNGISTPIIDEADTSVDNLQQLDCLSVNMLINLMFPAVALDLMYDVERNYKLVLEVKALQTKVTTRMFDRRIDFELREISVQDSFRADAQRDLCWTPPECDKLIYISHTVMSSERSPYFKKHGTEVIANFANLGLNVDVNTLMHLRPFFEVLLSRRVPEAQAVGTSIAPAVKDSNIIDVRTSHAPYKTILQSVQDLDSSISHLSMMHAESLNLATRTKNLNNAEDEEELEALPPKGMLIEATLSKISLDILRASATEERGTHLESAFSMQVSDLHLNINMLELMRAHVTLNSFEIIDIRTISRDYVFRKVFCPAAANVAAGLDTSFDDFLSNSDEENDSKDDFHPSPGSAPQMMNDVQEDLLTISYNQESKTHSYIEIDIANITSFVAIDTILDLTNVASANFFAMLALLKPPTTEVGYTLRMKSETIDETIDVKRMEHISSHHLAGTSALAVNSNTMNVVAKVRNPRLLLLEDPASLESKAIAGSCDIEVHYTRECKSNSINSVSSMFESLHVTTSQLEVFVLNNMMIQAPMPILLPIEIECHLKKKSVNDAVAFLNVQVEVDDVEARVTISDLLLAQSILNRRMLTETTSLDVDSGIPLEDNDVIMNKRKVETTATTGSYGDSYDLNGNSIRDRMSRRRSFTALAMETVPHGPPVFDFQFGMSSMNVVAVNDFGGQNVPILKLNVSNSRFDVEKNGELIAGDGSFTCTIDFYNVPFASWEPMLEVWRPCLRIYNLNGKGSTNILEVKSDHTMQITISGTLLQTLLRSYALLFQEEGEDTIVERSVVSQIEVHNSLGDDVPVQLFDSATKKLLIKLNGGGSGVITCHSNVNGSASSSRSRRLWSQSLHLPTTVDLQFQGILRHERLPLFHLPLNINKPKAYNLHPAAHSLDSFGSRSDVTASHDTNEDRTIQSANHDVAVSSPVLDQDSTSQGIDISLVQTDKIDPHSSDGQSVLTLSGKKLRAARTHVIEPIVEEVYENSRYDPISGSWRQPYMSNDPYEWTDASSLQRRDIGSISLNSDEWEWQGKWEVDMEGVIGEEIDREGWEYASSFHSFSIVNPRRTKKAMDAVRRRRWVRTRIPSARISSPMTRVLTLYWDIKTLKNGSKCVEMRSALQVMNGLSYQAHVLLSHNTWKDDVVLGPILPGETLNIPLLYSYANSIRIRPDFPLYNWSATFPCHAQAYDFRSVRDAFCGGEDVQEAWFRIISEQENRSVKIRLAPFITIINKLLCPLFFHCVVENKTSEEGLVVSGSQLHLTHINAGDNPGLLIKVGRYEWSNVVPINANTYPNCLFELSRSGKKKKAGKLYLSMNAQVGKDFGVEIEIFSKIAVLDKTGLDVYIGAKLRPDADIVRSTCNIIADTTKKVATSDSQSLDPTMNAPTPTTPNDETELKTRTADSLVASLSHECLTLPSPPLDAYQSPRGLDDEWATPDSNSFGVFQSGSQKKFSSFRKNLSNINARLDGRHNPVRRIAVDVQTISGDRSCQHLLRSVDVRSDRKYELVYCGNASTDGSVYTDSTTRWHYLPPGLQNQLQLRTPLDDKLQRSAKLVQFQTANNACIVYVLIDVVATVRWLKSDGFHRLSEIATARRINRGSLEESHFAIYGKFIEPNTEVTLRSSWNKQAPSMYTVFFVPHLSNVKNDLNGEEAGVIAHGRDMKIGTPLDYGKINQRSMQSQVEFSSGYSDDVAAFSWTEGGNNMAMVYSYDDLITVGLCRGTVWSEEINIDTRKNSLTKGSFEVDNHVSQISYQLSYTLQNMPGPFSETQLVTLMPRYCILNCTNEPLMVSQCGSEKYLEFMPYRPEGWHKLDLELGTELQWRTPNSLWSLGSIDINDIGTSVLYVPNKEFSRSFNTISGTILHVEVKLAMPADKCSILVVVWEETVNAHPTMMIRNNSAVPIVLRQAEIEVDHDLRDRMHLFEYRLAPNITLPFGWADPECGSDVLVAVGESLQGPNVRIAQINLLKSDQMLRLPYSYGKTGPKGEVLISVTRNNSGNCLEVSRMNGRLPYGNYGIPETGAAAYDDVLTKQQQESHSADSNSEQGKDTLVAFGINFLLSSFGVSLVVEKPYRREFLSLYVDWLEVYASVKGTMRSFEFMIRDLQVDNYSETMIYPVLLRSTKKEVHKSVAIEGEKEVEVKGSELRSLLIGEDIQNIEENTLSSSRRDASSSRVHNQGTQEEKPFIKFTLVQEFPNDGSKPFLRYVAFRMLSLAIEVDSATVRLLFTDLLDDLKILTNAQALAQTKPMQWLTNFNKTHLYPEQRLQLIDCYRSKIAAQKSKMYIKKLVAHPIKVTLTFIQVTFPRRQRTETLQSTFLNVVSALVGVEKLQLRLRSFEVDDAMESWNSLYDLILSKSLQDLRSQLTQIAGSLTMLGSPIGFARKVGRGVKAFFYEPYQGAVHGSQHFFIGLRKGTRSLFTGVVTGAMDSTVAIVGTASKGISYLSGDADYVRKRAMKRQQNRANRGGILDGIKDGGESVISGISSGVTGLVAKPVQEASKGGVKGFFRGLGLGLIGAAVKPVMGLSDGITSVAYGISNSVDPNSRVFHVRPPRALEPSITDTSHLMIVPLNLEAAAAQEFVVKRAKSNHYDDAFLSFIPLNNDGEAVVLSEVYVYWKKVNSLWGRVWANVSHCVFMGDSVGIMLYSGGENNTASLKVIPCGTASVAKKVYSALALNTARMGNPSNVIPVDIVQSIDDSCLTNLGNTSGLSSARKGQLKPQTTTALAKKDRRYTLATASELMEQFRDTNLLGTLDGYRFGSANGRILRQITGSEADILQRGQHYLERPNQSWQDVDDSMWQFLWEWGCVHNNLSSCRCSLTLIINRSESPIQISRVQLVMGRNILIIGSGSTGYETASRSILPDGRMTVFISAFPESPINIGHLKANINTASFSAVVASSQRESSCEAKGGFSVGFLEKTVTDWWSKYVIVVS